MDIHRPHEAGRKKRRRILIGGGLVLLIAAVTMGLSRLGPASPSVDRGTVWIDTVKRGPMLRQVRGSGTLVPTEVRWIPATSEGRVERVHVLPGTAVFPDTVLLELANPELDLAVLDAESAVKAGEAELTHLDVQLQSDHLTQQASAASVQASYHQAKLQAEANEAMAKDGLIADLTLKLSEVTAQELAQRSEIETQRLAMGLEAGKAQLAVQRTRVDQLRAACALRRSQRDALTVRAGIAGVLQQLPVEAGQLVTPGTTLAKIAEPGHLKAEVRIAETQASEIQLGQSAVIDTRNGLVPGHVVRIDPAAQSGTVTVDVALEGALPKGARPDLGVDGTITLESLENVLFVGRPAVGQEKGAVSLFKIVDGGAAAVRVPVKLGRASVGTVEILEGLQEKDQVILSDTAAQDGIDRIRLN
jgi:HlyD family secretion protein